MGAWFALPSSRRGSKRGATRQRMTAAAADGAKARQRLPGRKAPPPRRPPGGGGKYTDPITHLTAAPANRKKSLSKKSKPPTQKSDLSNMATYGYIRVSSAGQMDGTSPEEQKRKIDGLAMMRGEELANVFYDGGVSGSTPLDERPEGKKLLKLLKPGDVLIAAKLDRLFRDAADALTRAKEWKSQDVKVILVDMGTDPITENGTSKLLFGILASMAEWERERIAAARRARIPFWGARGCPCRGESGAGGSTDPRRRNPRCQVYPRLPR